MQVALQVALQMLARADITGIVLAGGRGSRMGGVDKGLQLHRGVPLALHAMQRLGAQVGRVAVNANRNLGAYEAFGAPVWPDAAADEAGAFAGPLAGMLSALERCETPYLATVPCDSPDFPADLVARLGSALLAQNAEIAMVATRGADGGVHAQPVFCLMRRGVHDSLARFLRSGQRKVERWAASLRCADVVFDDEAAFANANTAEELQRLEQRRG